MNEPNLGASARKGFKWSLIGNYGGQIVGFVISVILARLLSPEDFGIVGLSLAMVNMLKIIMSLGLNEALIQSKDVKASSFSSVFYFNLGIGILVTLLFQVCASSIALYYQRPILEDLTRLISIIYFLESLNIVQSTYLKKKLDFKALTIRSLIAQIIAGVVAVILAFQGLGLYALVVQHILLSVIGTLLIWRISDWRPSITFDWLEIKKLQSFAVYSFSSATIGRLILESKTLMIGKVFSPEILGFYARANSLVSLIVQNSSSSLRSILFPALSIIQDDEKRFKETYLRVSQLVTSISIFIIALSIINGPYFIVLVFGAKWAPAIPIFFWLMFRGLVTPINGIVVTSVLAKGRARENFYFGLVRHFISLISLTTLWFNDLQLTLTGFATSGVLILGVNIYMATKLLNISAWHQVKEILSSLLTSGSFILMLFKYVNFTNALVEVGLRTALYLTGFTLSVYFLQRPMLNDFKKYFLKRSV